MYLSGVNFPIEKHVLFAGWLFGVLLLGCDGGGDKGDPNADLAGPAKTESDYVGYWYAEAYGEIISVSEEHGSFILEEYAVTRDHCLRQSTYQVPSAEEMENIATYSRFPTEKITTLRAYNLPGTEYVGLDSLPVNCSDSLHKLKSEPGYVFNAEKDFEIFWDTFQELYVNFEIRGVDWEALYEEALTSVGDIQTEGELFHYLSELIAPLGDRHAVLVNAPLTSDLDASLAAAFENHEAAVFSASTKVSLYERLINEYLDQKNSDDIAEPAVVAEAESYFLDHYYRLLDIIFSYADTDSGVELKTDDVFWFKTVDNIGYLAVHSMDGDPAVMAPIFSEAIAYLSDASGIIIDIRFNDGGLDETSAVLVRHFLVEPRVLYSKFAGNGATKTPVQDITLTPHEDGLYLKPTALLVSGDTVSAAEVFVLAMKALPQVVVIGEPTAGAFSDILIKRLTSDIAFGLSNETYLDYMGINYEGVGIPVDIEVPFATMQERVDGYDGGLNAAIEWILGVL